MVALSHLIPKASSTKSLQVSHQIFWPIAVEKYQPNIFMRCSRALIRGLAPSNALKPLFLVPFDRDDSFVDRVEIFNDIDKYRKQHRRLALFGNGGVGSVASTA